MRKPKGYFKNSELLMKGGVLGNEAEMTTAEVNQILRLSGESLSNTVQDMREEIDGLMVNLREINSELDQYEQQMANYENIYAISETELQNHEDYSTIKFELNNRLEEVEDLKRDS